MMVLSRNFIVRVLTGLPAPKLPRRRHTTESRLELEHRAAIKEYATSQKEMEDILSKILKYQPLAEQVGVLDEWQRLLMTHEDIRLIVYGGFVTLSSHHYDSPEAAEARLDAKELDDQISAHRWNVDHASSAVREKVARMQLKAKAQQASSSTTVHTPTGEVTLRSEATETVVVDASLHSNSSSSAIIAGELVDLRNVTDIKLSSVEETEWTSNSSADERITWIPLDENPWQ